MSQRILCLALPNWPIQRLLAAQPELNPDNPAPATAAISTGLFLVLHQRDKRRGELVTACSRRAWQSGVRPGMPLTEARALARRSSLPHYRLRAPGTTLTTPSSTTPSLHTAPVSPVPPAPSVPRFLPHDLAADQAALHQLAIDCERFSPFVGWQTVGGPTIPSSPSSHAHLLLDITGIGRLFGDEETLARQLIAACQAERYWGRVAIGPTIGAAWAAALFPRTSTNLLQPTIEIISTEQLSSALGDRPVTALRLPPDRVELLRQLGVHQIAQLQTLPRAALATRLGPHPLIRLDQAYGAQTERIEPLRPPPRDQVDYCLEEPTTDGQVLHHLAERLLVELTRELAQRGEGLLRLDIRLDCAAQRPLEYSIGLFRPTASPQHLLQLLTTQWERRRWPSAVGRLQLRATLTAALESRQGLLFAADERALDSDRQLGDLLERLSSRLGLSAVLRPRLCREALPERAFRYETAVGGKRSARNSRTTKSTRDTTEELAALGPLGSVAARPCELRHPPEAIAVVAIAHDGPPATFHWQQQSWRVTRHWGPERIETGWWRGPSQRRDYYRVETSSGQRFWLYRDLTASPTQSHWFLQGLFS